MATTAPAGGKHALGLLTSDHEAEISQFQTFLAGVKALLALKLPIRERTERYKALVTAYDAPSGEAIRINDAQQDRLEARA